MEIGLEIAQIAARLLKGESFESLIRSFLPKAERELLKYCASARTFDEKMLDEFFRPNVEGGKKEEVPFSRLLEHSFVQPVPGAPGFYQLREDSRRDYFELWHKGSQSDVKVPPALRSLSKTLASYYQSLGPDWTLEVLYQQIAADSNEAERLFRELYDAADSVFDLGRCQDLIKILEARNTILYPNLRDLHEERQNYLKARGFWSKEYYQTVYYHERTELTDRFDELIQDKSKWILQLHAPGGSGKTIFLRWLTSRRCAREPLKIPCAKIDFDLIDPVAATRNPWMLVLEIAQQLNEQIPKNMFSEQLGDLKEFRPVLTRSDTSRRLLSKFESRSGNDELVGIPGRFVKALKAAHLDRKVVFIFDTLEEVILYQGTNMMALLAEMKKLHDAYGNICLILSGRYDLNKKLPGFSEFDKGSCQTLELTPFSDDDAKSYLREKRGITRLVDIAVEKAQGNPFKLALYADILRFSPRTTEKEIRDYPSDLLYLIRRVLFRIRNRRVRWLLRYGVIPRKLRLSFVREVMAPYLPPAMAGASSVDDPVKDLKKEFEEENAFKKVLRSPDQRVNVDRLWNILKEYASSYSWVSQDDEANTLSFHSDVLNPMRAVLRNQKVYRKLHRAAIRHYERKVKDNPTEWGNWILEAIYHKFQLDGVEAGDYWRQQLEHAAAEHKPKWRLDFAREVINLSKTEEERSTDEQARPPLVDQQLVAQAYFEVARANVEIARSLSTIDPQDAVWQETNKAFAVFQQLQANSGRTVSPARRACVEAAILTNQGKRTEAFTVLERTLKQRASAKDKIALQIEYAGALALKNRHKDAAKNYRKALLLASKARIKASWILEIRKELARRYELCGDVKEAIQEYKTALSFARKKNDDLAALELSRQLAEIHLASGQLAKATEFAYPNARYDLPNLSARGIWKDNARGELIHYLNLQGRIALAVHEPLKALQRSTELSRVVEIAVAEGWQEQDLDQLTASARELSGLVAGELMQESQALDYLEQARISWNETKDMVGAARCLLHMIDIQFNVAGNVKAAKFLLEHAERLNLKDQPDIFIRQELLGAEILTQMGKSAEALRRLQGLAARAKHERWLAKDRAAIAIANMIQRATKTRTTSLREVVATLKQVRPPLSRLTLLQESYLCPTPKKASALATPFAKLLPEPDWNRVDAAVNALRLADALRVVGKKLSPRSLLQRAEKEFGQVQNFFALREVYQTWDRLGWTNRNLLDLSLNLDKVLNTLGNYRSLCGSILLEQAQRLLLVREFEAAQKTIDQAALCYEEASDGTQSLAQLNELRGRLLIERNLPRHTRDHRPEKETVALVREGFKALSYARTIYDGLQNQVAAKNLSRYLLAEKRRLQAAVSTHKSTKKKTKSIKATRASLPRLDHEYAKEFEQKIKLPTNTFALRLRRQTPKSLDFRAEFDRGRQTVRKQWKVTSSSLLQLFAARSDEIFSKSFCEAFPDHWWNISRDMAHMLLETTFQKVPPPTSGPLPDFVLDLDDVILAGIPWEFALLGAPGNTKSGRFFEAIATFYRNPASDSSHIHVIKAIQFGLQKLLSQRVPVDGVYGPLTLDAVRTFQRKHKLSATGIADFETIAQIRAALLRKEKATMARVLIAHSSSDRQLSSMRGHGSEGIDLYRLYRRAGFLADAVENPTIRTLGQALKGTGAQIVHLCPSMKRSLSSGIYLDFGTSHANVNLGPASGASSRVSGAASGEANYFSLSAVGKLLAEFASGKSIRPLIILDVPAPPVTSEAVIQLVLRNAFASEVFRMGNTCAVLATGLMDRRQHTYVEMIVHSLAANRGLGDLVREIRKIPQPIIRRFGKKSNPDPETLSLILGPMGTALFGQNPTSLP